MKAEYYGNLNQQLFSREYNCGKVSFDFAMRKLEKTYEFDGRLKSSFFWLSPVFASEFCPNPSNGSLLVSANEDGYVLLWDTERGKPSEEYQGDLFLCHNNAIFDVKWSYKDPRFVTASGDHTIVVWEYGRGDIKDYLMAGFHSHTVKSVAWNPTNASVIASGDRGGSIYTWDTRTNKLETRISLAHEREFNLIKFGKKTMREGTSITGMTFYQEHNLLTAAAGDCYIRMWDMRKSYSAYRKKPLPVQEFYHDQQSDKSGYAYLLMDHESSRLYGTTVNDRIYSFALSTSTVTTAAVLLGSELRSFYAKSSLSPDGNYLISGSRSACALIWNTRENCGGKVFPVRSLKTRGTEVNAPAWCKSPKENFKIVTCPECETCEVWDVHSSDVPRDQSKDSKTDRSSNEIENDAMVKSIKNAWSCESLQHNDRLWKPCYSDGFTQNDLLENVHPNRTKRVLEELLGDAEVSQNKKMRHEFVLRPAQLLATSYNPEVYKNVYNNAKPVFPCSINEINVPSKDTISDCGFDQLGPLSQGKEKSVDLPADSHLKTFFSPTSNLPNHVVDGTSPSHVCKTHRKKHVDWLTELRQGKVVDLKNNTPRKSVVESNPKKIQLSKKMHEKQHKSILNYFPVLGKSNDEELKSSQECGMVPNDHSIQQNT